MEKSSNDNVLFENGLIIETDIRDVSAPFDVIVPADVSEHLLMK